MVKDMIPEDNNRQSDRLVEYGEFCASGDNVEEALGNLRYSLSMLISFPPRILLKVVPHIQAGVACILCFLRLAR